MTTYISPIKKSIIIQKLFDKINSEFEEEIIPVIPEEYAKNRYCLYNVEQKIKNDGGSVCFGWSIYQSEDLCEAEKHVVWENPEGDLIDVTPNEVGLTQIMFLPDNRYKNVDELNVRINLSDSKAIDTLISLFSIDHQIYLDYAKKNNDRFTMPEDVKRMQDEVKNIINFYQDYIGKGVKKFTVCYCGSNKSYNNCHSNITIKELNRKLANFRLNRK
jgi:hypothetical protein